MVILCAVEWFIWHQPQNPVNQTISFLSQFVLPWSVGGMVWPNITPHQLLTRSDQEMGQLLVVRSRTVRWKWLAFQFLVHQSTQSLAWAALLHSIFCSVLYGLKQVFPKYT